MKWVIFDVLAVKASFVGAVVKFTITGKIYKKCILKLSTLAETNYFLYIWIASAWDAGLYYITLQVGENGQVIAPNTAMADDLVKLTIVPAEGYQLKSLMGYIGKSELVINEDFTFNMPPVDVTIIAEFEEIPTPTGIKNLTPALSQGEGAWYDLNGRKLQAAPTQKGVYIQNGKKLFVK